MWYKQDFNFTGRLGGSVRRASGARRDIGRESVEIEKVCRHQMNEDNRML